MDTLNHLRFRVQCTTNVILSAFGRARLRPPQAGRIYFHLCLPESQLEERFFAFGYAQNDIVS